MVLEAPNRTNGGKDDGFTVVGGHYNGHQCSLYMINGVLERYKSMIKEKSPVEKKFELILVVCAQH